MIWTMLDDLDEAREAATKRRPKGPRGSGLAKRDLGKNKSGKIVSKKKSAKVVSKKKSAVCKMVLGEHGGEVEK